MSNANLIRGNLPRPLADGAAVLWVFRGYDSRWYVRTEGDVMGETPQSSRQEAVESARKRGDALGYFRIYIQLRDGRFIWSD